MRSSVDEVIRCRSIVVGAGVAGLTAALGLARHGACVVLTKSSLGTGCSSAWAQGGVAAAMGEGDSSRLHAADTMAAGAGLSHSQAVNALVEDGPAVLRRLIERGARFDSDIRGAPLLTREAAHSLPRILHARDATGAEIVRTLVEAVRVSPAIQVFESAFAEDIVTDAGRTAGLTARLGDGRRVLFLAPALVLASGGLGRLFAHTTNPPESTGDGLAMAARAGVRLADLEFVQFHPTALKTHLDPMPLMTEALRGEGAWLVDGQGRRFMLDEHPSAELAPRDVVARAIWRLRQEGQEIFLDATRAIGRRLPQRFPTVFEHCRRAGIDPRSDLIPVSPAAHYFIGGIAVDLMGRSSLSGLWACGEAAASGVHGANRLASNSLLEALVYGERTALDVGRFLGENMSEGSRALKLLSDLPASPLQPMEVAETQRRIQLLRQVMWEKVGLVRHQDGLLHALDFIGAAQSEGVAQGEYRNLLAAARLISQAALLRRESRGVHFRSDHPVPLEAQRRRRFSRPLGKSAQVMLSRVAPEKEHFRTTV